MWLDLGIELLQEEDVAALKTIKSSVSDCTVRCSEMSLRYGLPGNPKQLGET